jgi:hypothetical protein
LNEIFDSLFFHQSTPPRALIHGPKPFRKWLRIRRDNCFESRQNQFQRVNDPAETKMKSRILFLKYRHGMGIFPYELQLLLRVIPLKKIVGPRRRFEIRF